jgi:peptidoglycan hydrolase CwlO-like protein
MTATPPEASPTSTISSFFMGEEKPFSEVDQMQRDFETKIKNKHEDILKLNKKKDMKTKKINKYLVSKFD